MGIFDQRDRRRRGVGGALLVEEIDVRKEPEELFPTSDSSEDSDAPGQSSREERAALARGHYGLDQLIELIGSLPADNPRAAVDEVRNTLVNHNMRLKPMIEEATNRLRRSAARQARLQEDIEHLERQIERRGEQLTALAVDIDEVTRVRERLMRAEELIRTGPGNTATARSAAAALAGVLDPGEGAASKTAAPTSAAAPSKPASTIPIPSDDDQATAVDDPPVPRLTARGPLPGATSPEAWDGLEAPTATVTAVASDLHSPDAPFLTRPGTQELEDDDVEAVTSVTPAPELMPTRKPPAPAVVASRATQRAPAAPPPSPGTRAKKTTRGPLPSLSRRPKPGPPER